MSTIQAESPQYLTAARMSLAPVGTSLHGYSASAVPTQNRNGPTSPASAPGPLPESERPLRAIAIISLSCFMLQCFFDYSPCGTLGNRGRFTPGRSGGGRGGCRSVGVRGIATRLWTGTGCTRGTDLLRAGVSRAGFKATPRESDRLLFPRAGSAAGAFLRQLPHVVLRPDDPDEPGYGHDLPVLPFRLGVAGRRGHHVERGVPG